MQLNDLSTNKGAEPPCQSPDSDGSAPGASTDGDEGGRSHEKSMLARRWEARLALEYGFRDGRSVLTRREHFGPLRVQRNLYPEGQATCHTIVVHPPGGIAAGDRLSVQAKLGEGSAALLTTPGAGKWYRCLDAGYDVSALPRASQTLDFAVEAGANLEWLPQESILFDGAVVDMTTRVSLGAGASYLGWDILCFGRTASGERYQSGALRTRTEIVSDGVTLWREQGSLRAGEPMFTSPAGLAGRTVSATLIAAGRDTPDDVLAQCRAIDAPDGALAGITRLPKVLIARWLGDSSEDARHYFAKVWALLRPGLSGREAQTPRIWAT